MNRLLVVSQGKMGLFGINEDFTSRFALMASHMQVPGKNGEENSFQKVKRNIARFLCPWNSPGKNTGVSSHSLFQGIFHTLRSNPGLLHCKWIVYCLSHQGSPIVNKEYLGEIESSNYSDFSLTELWQSVIGLALARQEEVFLLPVGLYYLHKAWGLPLLTSQLYFNWGFPHILIFTH